MFPLRVAASASTLGKMHPTPTFPGLVLDQATVPSGAPSSPRRLSLRPSWDRLRGQTFERIKITRSPSGAGEFLPGRAEPWPENSVSPCLCLLIPSHYPAGSCESAHPGETEAEVGCLSHVWGQNSYRLSLGTIVAAGRGKRRVASKLGRTREFGDLETQRV